MSTHNSKLKTKDSAGFSLIELLVAATIFAFIVTGVTGLFIQALDIQRRASGIQKIEENVQFVFESVSREVRVSVIDSGNSNCTPPDPGTTRRLSITHPVNGVVTYEFFPGVGTRVGMISRTVGAGLTQAITSSDVNIKAFAFCVKGSGQDGRPARLTMAATMESVLGRPSTRVSASAQTTVVSRDLASDLSP